MSYKTQEFKAFEISQESPHSSNSFRWIPLLETVRAGDPIGGTKVTTVDPMLLIGHAGFALRVNDNSMIGGRIYEADVVIVVMQEQVGPNDIAVVAVDDNAATLKRIKRQGDMCMLIPSNPALSPDLVECDRLKIIGKIVEVRIRTI